MYTKQKIVRLRPIHTPRQSRTGAGSGQCTASTAWPEHWGQCNPVKSDKQFITTTV